MKMEQNTDKKPLRTVADYREALEEASAGRGRIGSYKPYDVDYFRTESQRTKPLPCSMDQLATPFKRLIRKTDGLHRHNLASVLRRLGELDRAFDPRRPILPRPLRDHRLWQRLLDKCPRVFGVLVRYVGGDNDAGGQPRRLSLVQTIDDQLNRVGTKWESLEAVRKHADYPNAEWGDEVFTRAAVINRNRFRLSRSYAKFREFAAHDQALFPEELKREIVRASMEIEQFLDSDYLEMYRDGSGRLVVQLGEMEMAGKYQHMLRDWTRKDRAKAVSNVVGLQIWDELRTLDLEKARISDNELDRLVYSMMHVLFPVQHQDFPTPSDKKRLHDRVRQLRDRANKRRKK